jgi:hypothetical protein
MRLKRDGYLLTLSPDPGESSARNESDLFYRLKKVLQSIGEDVIKKLMWKDGHMVHESQYYVRSRKPRQVGAYGVYDHYFNTRDAAKDYNAGAVRLRIVPLGDWEPRPFSQEGVLDWMP